MNSQVTRIAPDAIRLERRLPGPIENVWSFLTDSEKRGRWLAHGEWELRSGGKVEMHFSHEMISPEETPAKYRGMPMSFTGRILRIDPPNLVEFTWDEADGAASEVTFELTPRGQEVILVITHRKVRGRDMLLSASAGWDVHAGILQDVLTNQPPRGFWSAHARVEREYARLFTD